MIRNLSFTKQPPDLATLEEIKSCEGKLGFRFQPAFVEFCLRWNGGFPDRQNRVYPVPRSFELYHHEYKNSSGVLVLTLYGVTPYAPCSLTKAYALLNEDSDLGIMPIAGDLFGNQVVVRTDASTETVFWKDRDLWEPAENPQPGPQYAEKPYLMSIADNLEMFYNGLTVDPDGE